MNGKKPFGKESYLALMIEITDGILPKAMMFQHIDNIWGTLTQHNEHKKLNEKHFGSLFTSVDILSQATITM